MANTYSQINIHCIFAVKGRGNLLTENFRYNLFKYLAGILKNDGSYPLAIGGWKDHVHAFFELPVKLSVAERMRMLKASSSKWINDNNFINGKFQWQAGYGAFTYSRSQRDKVIKYIINQEEHHKKITFREEYIDLLLNFKINFDKRYLYEFYE